MVIPGTRYMLTERGKELYKCGKGIVFRTTLLTNDFGHNGDGVLGRDIH
jgi:hypothetical protein